MFMRVLVNFAWCVYLGIEEYLYLCLKNGSCTVHYNVFIAYHYWPCLANGLPVYWHLIYLAMHMSRSKQLLNGLPLIITCL